MSEHGISVLILAKRVLEVWGEDRYHADHETLSTVSDWVVEQEGIYYPEVKVAVYCHAERLF